MSNIRMKEKSDLWEFVRGTVFGVRWAGLSLVRSSLLSAMNRNLGPSRAQAHPNWRVEE